MYRKYTPSHNWFEFGFREIWQYRELLLSFSIRDVKLRYRQTFLGILWVILQPILTSVIFSVIFGVLAKLPSDQAPYELFSLAGLLPWNLFSQTIQRAGRSVVKEREVFTKVYFPVSIIPFSSAGSAIVDFFISLVTIMIIFFAYGYYPTWKITALPFLVTITLLLSLGVGFIVSALNVYYRDFVYALPFLLQVWLYASPIVYSTSLIPENWQFIYDLNPMVGIITGFRWMLLDGDVFPWSSLLISTGLGMFVFLLGVFLFKRLSEKLVDVV